MTFVPEVARRVLPMWTAGSERAYADNQADQERSRRAGSRRGRHDVLGRQSPRFGVKVTLKGRKVFVALYRTKGGSSRLRNYTIGPYGRITLQQARATAQRVFT